MRFYTMANDARSADFSRFCSFLFAFNPDACLYVIPFQDECPDISNIVTKDARITLIRTDPLIDDIGREVYGDECYRPDVPSWRYFRKFNAFYGHSDPFVFLDANSIVLSSWGSTWYFPKMNKHSVYFRGPSKMNRTVLSGHFSDSLSALGLGSETGYNMGGFISHGGVFDPVLGRSVARPELRRVFGRAPEQAFMAFYLSVFGIENGLMTALEPSIWLRYQGESLVTEDGRTFCGNNARKTFALTKYTGAEYTQHAVEIEKVLQERLLQIGASGQGR